MALKIAKTTNTMSGKQLEAIGTRAFELGDLDKALDNLLAALEQDDQNASLFLKVGVIQVQKGNIDKALIAIKRSLELAPYDADAYNAMGVVLSLLEFWGAAEKFFRKALMLDPTHASAKSSLVDTMKRMRDGDNEPPAEFGTVLALLETQEPRLSLCMIAKNEEQFLGDCLASVRGLVDEIILVDTGSTDRTVAIAESFGAKIFHFPWNGDFAAARNESLAHATGDWILVLDADETIPADGHAELRKVLRSKDYAGYSMIIENLLGEEGEKSQTALIFRLFQNRPDIRFEGIIHEQAMLAAQRTGLPINNVRTRIIHRGYLDQHLTQRDKYQRNLDILLRQVEQDPQNPYALFNLGQTYKLMNRFSESEQAYKTSLALLENQKAPYTTSYWPSLFFSLADLYRLMGELEKGLDVAEEALSRYPNFPDILFTKGFILLGLDRFEEAITIFQACRSFKGIVYASGNDPSVSTYKSSQALGAAYARMGQHAVAKRYYLQALQEWDHPNAELYTNLGVVHLQLGELQPALQSFIKAVELNERNSQAWGNIGYICQQFGQHEEALTARAKAYGLDPVENGFAFGTALLHAKNFAEAERVLTDQTELKSDHAPGWIYLGLIKLCLGKLDEAMQTWQHLEKRPELDEKSREDASALLSFSRMLAGDQILAGEAGSFSSREGEFWALLVSHLLLAERYSDVERALQVLRSLAVPGLDLAMGRMLCQHGLHDEAMVFLLKAQERSPEDIAVYVLLGEAAEGMKNVEDAQVMYQMALSLDPKQVAIRQRLGRLRLLVTSK
jgi:tetratricopeptide (TPR) repeat protein